MTGSNRRPPACKAGALPAELIPHLKTVCLGGLEPPTPALSRRCSNQLSYRPFTFVVKRPGWCFLPARCQSTKLFSAQPAHVHTLCSTTADKCGRKKLSAIFQKGGDP